MKKRVLVVISNDLFVRNYLQTDALSALREKYDVLVSASESVSMKKEVEAEEGFSGFFGAFPRVEARHFLYFNILTFRFQKRSRTFPFRLHRSIGWHLRGARNRRWENLRLLRRSLRKLHEPEKRQIWWCVLFGNRLVFPVFRRLFEAGLGVNRDLERLIARTRPDLVMVPSNAYDPIGNDSVRIARRHGIPSFYLVDNWDNLCSKSIFWAVPDFLGLWSEQQEEQASRIHSIEKERTHRLGTPRFHVYLEARGRAGGSRFGFPYVVFTGCALPFDETAALVLLEEELETHRDLYSGLKIVYRPHPWRQKRNREEPFREADFRHVVLDPQVRDEFLVNYRDMSTRTQFQPDINYYPSLMENSMFMMGPLTTMLLESLIFHKRFLAICYDDKKHFTSPHNALEFYEHFEGIEQHAGMTMCADAEQLGKRFRSLFQDGAEPDRTSWDRQLDRFLRMDEVAYPERLQIAVDGVLRVRQPAGDPTKEA